MTTSDHDPDDLASLELDPRCFSCGGPARAFWTGSVQTVFVCGACAITELAPLIAEAIADGRPTGDVARHADAALDRFRAAYWRGVALALSRRSAR